MEGMNFHPDIPYMWGAILLGITKHSWLGLGSGYLSVEDAYYLILAFPCFFGFFPCLMACELFRKFESRHPWVCEKCCKRFRYGDQLESHNIIFHLQPSTRWIERLLKRIQPFRVKNPVIDFYCQFVSLDFDFEIFYCPLCQNVNFTRFSAMTFHLIQNHVRYLSACSCAACRSSPSRRYQWFDFLHGDEQMMIYEEERPDCPYRIPIKVSKRCPADPVGCHETFETSAKEMERMTLHLIIEHKW